MTQDQQPTRFRATAHLVDGDALDLPFTEDLYNVLAAFETAGYRERALLDRVFGDDWGTPPRAVVIRGLTAEGRAFERHIPYA